VPLGCALELNPSDAFVHDRRGSTLLYLGRFDEALAAKELAIHLDPAGVSIGSAFDFMLVHYMLGNYPAALLAADRAIARYPRTPEMHILRAATLAQMGESDEATKEVDAVRNLDPFFEPERYGTRFVNPEHRARVQDGLRKAGFQPASR
jgi:adenylate cyclase